MKTQHEGRAWFVGHRVCTVLGNSDSKGDRQASRGTAQAQNPLANVRMSLFRQSLR